MSTTIFSDPENEVAAFPHATKPATVPRAEMATKFPDDQDDQDDQGKPDEQVQEDEEVAPEGDDLAQEREPKPDEADQDDEQDDDAGEAGKEPPPARRRWDPRGSGTRPAYWDHRPDPRRSGIEWWKHLRTQSRHGLYNASALGVGWYLEIPQWVTHQTAYLVANWDSLTSVNTYFWSCSVVAVGVWDYQTRHLMWPLAWLCRVPAVCLVVGVLLYGNPALPA